MGLAYFYDYFAKEYREGRRDRLLSSPAAMFRGIDPEDVKSCRRALKKAFAGYREGRNTEALKRLLGRYREYVSCYHDGHAKDRYNAFVYRYMVEVHVGNRAISAKLGVVKKTVLNYIDRCIDEMLVLCMGIPAAGDPPEDKEAAVCMLIQCSRLLGAMAGDDVLCLFPGKMEREAVQQGRRLTNGIMEQLADAVRAYSEYCNDGHTRIDTDIRKAEILGKCLAGVPPAAIAEEYGCCEATVYADIRENEKRLAAMLFDVEGG
ncbi:MAG: hypothetical protein NC389_16945 [Acetatifactor muris]|nr:hypothetical protein [Acetatifactor muris]